MISESNKIWKKLTECHTIFLRRGSLIAFYAGSPFEDKVVMMICETRGGAAASLICITGYKAGFDPYVVFPSEALVQDDNGFGVDGKWLRDNFEKWIFPGVDKKNIWISESPIEVELIFPRNNVKAK